MRNFEVQNVLDAEFFGGHAAQLVAVAVGEYPLVPVRVIHDVDLFPSVDSSHVTATVVHRHMPRRIDLASHQAVRQVFGNCATTATIPISRAGVVSPSRMDQAREEGHAAESVSVRIGLAVEPVHPFQRAACSSSGVAHVQGSHHRFDVPCDRSTTPFSSGLRGLFQCISIPSPSAQSDRSVGKSPDDPQGVPLSTRRQWGRPQR